VTFICGVAENKSCPTLLRGTTSTVTGNTILLYLRMERLKIKIAGIGHTRAESWTMGVWNIQRTYAFLWGSALKQPLRSKY
jgi:hypothetical protein